MFDKNQIWVIFLFEFKMGHKAAETICNISNAPGPGTANRHSVQWWVKKFCKGDESLEDEMWGDWPSKVDNTQLTTTNKKKFAFCLTPFLESKININTSNKSLAKKK